MRFRSISFLAVFTFLFSIQNYASDKNDKKKKEWDVTATFGPTKQVEFTTTEGTWMNLDVSPDGDEIVFDLLGDIFIIPIAGGKATLLSGGPAYEVQPRFSPNGNLISFTSDRGGGDNIWVMSRDGSGAQVGDQRRFSFAQQCLLDPGWQLPDCPQAFYQPAFPRRGRNVDVPYFGRQGLEDDQAQKRPAGCG